MTPCWPAPRSVGRPVARWVPVYEYEFDHTPNPFILAMPGIDLGAFHAAELPYVFGAPTESSGNFTFTPAEQHLSDTVAGAWARFAATGSPSGGGLTWPRLTTPSGAYLVLDTPTSVATGMKADPCRFWARTGWTVADLLGSVGPRLDDLHDRRPVNRRPLRRRLPVRWGHAGADGPPGRPGTYLTGA